MPSRPPREHLSHDLIGQYLFGKLPERTRNRVERHLLECEFCSDAVDGYSGQPNPLTAGRQLDDLRSRLNKRVNRFRLVLPFGMQPYAVAASVVLLVTCTLAVWLTIHLSSKPAPAPQAVRVTPPAATRAVPPTPAAELPPAGQPDERVAVTPGAEGEEAPLAEAPAQPDSIPAAANELLPAVEGPRSGEAQIAEKP
ncbi:MAG: hypothetical protein AVDCRST_MAG56-5991, partial [uncultured Cytophagales bacterium]